LPASASYRRRVDVEQRAPMTDRAAEREVAARVDAIADGVSRRRLLAAAAGVAGCGLAAAAALPAASLGPGADTLGESPWRRGTRLMTSDGRPLKVTDVPLGGFDTAYPEGADPRELGSPVVVVHNPVSEQTSSGPALVCPCHYSTFDVRRGGKPVFGPAVRALPTLPIAAGPGGELRATGGLSASVGPSWWRVQRT
jgi:ubiquinol-cytochrome c reductase iron-sulfur subunit